MPLSGARLPLYTNARLNAPIRLQMPLCVMPRAMPAPKCLAQMPLCAPKCPALAGGIAPIHARKCPDTSSGGNNPLVFDIPVRVSVYKPPIIPQNAPIRRGKCPAMCAGKIKCPAMCARLKMPLPARVQIKCPALYAPVRKCPYIRAYGPIPPEPPDRLNRSGPPDLSGPIPDRRVF